MALVSWTKQRTVNLLTIAFALGAAVHVVNVRSHGVSFDQWALISPDASERLPPLATRGVNGTMTHRKARLSPISLYSSAPLLDISNRCCADPVSWSRLSPELLPKSSNRIVTALRCYLAGHTALAGTEVFGESPELSIPGRTRILVKDAVIREIIDKLIPTPYRRLRRPRRLIGVGHSVQGARCLVGVGGGADQLVRAGRNEGLCSRSVRLPSDGSSAQCVGKVIVVLWFAGRGLLLRLKNRYSNMPDVCRFDPERCQISFRRLLYRCWDVEKYLNPRCYLCHHRGTEDIEDGHNLRCYREA